MPSAFGETGLPTCVMPHILRISLQAQRHELPERLGEGLIELRWRVARDQEKYLHRVKVRVRWFTFGHLHEGDACRRG